MRRWCLPALMALSTLFVFGGDPGGSDGELQYNNGGTFGGATGATYDDTTGESELKIHNGRRELHLFATGGDGTTGSPWTGMFSAFAPNVEIHAKRGYYEVPDIETGFPDRMTLICEDGAIFKWSVSRASVYPMFRIPAGSKGNVIRGCRFEAGVTVPPLGMSDGTGGFGYFTLGLTGSSATIEDVVFENNYFDTCRHLDNDSDGHSIAIQSSVDGAEIRNNFFGRCPWNVVFLGKDPTLPQTFQNIHITGNRFRYDPYVDLAETIGIGAANSGGLPYSEFRRVVISNNTWDSHNGTMTFCGRIYGLTVSDNVSFNDEPDFFFLSCDDPGSFIDGFAISGNTVYGDTTPRTTPTNGLAAISVSYARNGSIANNSLFNPNYGNTIRIIESQDISVTGNTVENNGTGQSCYATYGSTNVLFAANAAINCGGPAVICENASSPDNSRDS